MPWSNQSGGSGNNNGGPWGQRGGSGNGGGPWGGGPKGNGEPPDFDKIIRSGQDRIKNILPTGGNIGFKGILFFVLAAIILWLSTGFYTVRPNEVAVELIFGKYRGKKGEGLKYNWPAPIGEVRKLDVTQQQTTIVGFKGQAERARPILEEALMLTGDDNVVFINFTVVWNISREDAQNYAFKFKDPKSTVKAVAESAMREYIGRGRIMELITEKRLDIAPAVQQSIQSALESYKMGIHVSSVQVISALAPEEVRQAFYDVEAASQKADRYLQEAGKTVNEILPKARGDAAQIRAIAQGYRQSKIEEATGQASRFTQVLEEYSKAPEVIRERMYLETMERVYNNASKTIVNTDSSTIINMGSGANVIPLPQAGKASVTNGATQ